MSQEIRVLNCFTCGMFQTDIVKKSNKWQCKVCNSKQSVKREYFRGSGAECRVKAQKLNMEIRLEERNKRDIACEMEEETQDAEFQMPTNHFETNRMAADVEPSTELIKQDRILNDSEMPVCNFSLDKKWTGIKDKTTTATNKKSKWSEYI